MKIFSILLIFLTSCTFSDLTTIDPSKLKFKAGQKVQVAGFYSNCEGYITGYNRYTLAKIPELGYYVNFDCHKAGIVNNIFVSETNIK